MHSSGRNHPCPVCSRVKDADCRWSDEIILCHTGTDDRPGTVITIDGKQWALIRHNGGFSGQAAVYRPHRDDFKPNGGAPRCLDLEAKAKRSTISFQITNFLEHFHEAWSVPDFHSLAPQELQQAFQLIERTSTEGLTLARALAPVWRQYPDLADHYRWRIEACNKNLKYQQQDVHHFRQHYLGEVVA